MNIKIPPYPNFIIKEETFKESNVKITKKTSSEGLTNKLIMMIPFKEDEKRIIRARSIKHDEKIYISAMPNPVHLFLNLGIENFNLSEEIKRINFPHCGKAIGKDIYILDIEENGTHECYNNYIKYRTSSIIMLVSSLEAFLNHIIPNDFVYKTPKKSFTKIDIESPKIFFKDKLENVIPQSLSQPKFWETIIDDKTTIFELYNNRKNLIHLKTNAEDDFAAYFDVIDEMLDLDIIKYINSLITFMNKAKPNFIEVE